MKSIILFISLLFISYNSQANDIAIEAVKSNEEVILFLADKSSSNYQITFQKIELGGICGFVGCNWRNIVSIVVTSKKSNATSTTILALVEGVTTNKKIPPTVTFITFNRSPSNKLVAIK